MYMGKMEDLANLALAPYRRVSEQASQARVNATVGLRRIAAGNGIANIVIVAAVLVGTFWLQSQVMIPFIHGLSGPTYYVISGVDIAMTVASGVIVWANVMVSVESRAALGFYAAAGTFAVFMKNNYFGWHGEVGYWVMVLCMAVAAGALIYAADLSDMLREHTKTMLLWVGYTVVAGAYVAMTFLVFTMTPSPGIG